MSMPPPPPPAPVPTGQPSNGIATAGFIVGLVAIFINTFFIPAILGVILSSVGLAKASNLERATGIAHGRGLAIAGLVLSCLAIVNSVLWKWMVLFLF